MAHGNNIEGFTAVGYVRISDADQSNFSIEGQKANLLDFCKRFKVNLQQIFTDDGRSGANFDRDGWRDLEQTVKSSRKKINLVLVYAYDRFSRNAGEALMMISKFEQRHECVVISTTQYMGLSVKDPYFYTHRANILVNAEHELRTLKKRTSDGVRRCAQEGYYPFGRIFGYKSSGQAKHVKRKVIEKHPEQSAAILEMARLCIEGHTDAEIKKLVKVRPDGKECISRILTNRFYAGWIWADEVDGKPAQWVRGKHEALFTDAEFSAIQQARLPKRRRRETYGDENIPLRGVLICGCCNTPVTGGPSKGKSGKKWWYYRCLNCGLNVSAAKADERLKEILQGLSMDFEAAKQIRAEAKRYVNALAAEQIRKAKTAKERQKMLKDKIELLDIRMIDGDIDAKTYKSWHAKFTGELSQVEIEMNGGDQAEILEAMRLVDEYVMKLSELSWVYGVMDSNDKRTLVSAIFPEGLMIEKKAYRTPKINGLLLRNPLQISNLALENAAENSDDFQKNQVSTPYGALNELLEIVSRAA